MEEGIRPITDTEFERFRKLIYKKAGISMAPAKKVLVAGRLSKRLRHYGLQTFDQYYQLATDAVAYPGELQVLVDQLTTNETYFFREPGHFELLQQALNAAPSDSPCRIWSAACSSGEEVYTLAMVLAETLGQKPWDILGSDISSRMLESCRRGVYPMSRKGPMKEHYLHHYCLKGVRSQEGQFLVSRSLRERCAFRQINLMEPIPEIGRFDFIFLRNVMIYFDACGKQKVVSQLLRHLKPGGLLFVSHSETLHGMTSQLVMVQPSVYRKRHAVD